MPDPRTKVDPDKEDAVGEAKTVDMGPARSLAPGPRAFKEESRFKNPRPEGH
jgi:hypothetical protein